MIYQSYTKRLFYPAFAAILTVMVLAMSNTIVKSQRAADFKPSPFKFNRLPAPNEEKLNNVPLPTTGNLDPTFGTGGKLTTDFSSSEVAGSVAVQADGKIIAAGSGSTSGNYDFAVFRYNADGSLDTSFDGDGKVTTDVGDHYNDFAYTIAIQTDGKIIAAGTSGDGGFVLVRYNADGSLDASFGTGGKVITAILDSAIYDIAIQTDGKIVAAGTSYNDATGADFTLARYNGDGSLDASFGAGGKVTTDFENFYDYALGVAIQTDGKIVAAGFRYDGKGYSDFALSRYNTDGSLDTSFDADGKVTTTFGGGGDAANAVAIQTDGKIVAVGYSNTIGGFALARYNINGSLDTSFDGDGKVETQVGGYGGASSIAIQSNGKIVAAGYSDNGVDDNFALARFNADGSLDTSFDADGKVTTSFGGEYETATDVAIQADGKIVAVGYTGAYSNSDFALSRYNADGSLDSAFDGDGKLTTSLFIANSAAKAVAIQENGGIVLAGSSNNGANCDFAVLVYGAGFIVTTDFGGGNDAANAVAIQADGKIVAAGYSTNGSSRDFALVRYNADGSLDTTFDGDGKVITDLGAFDDEAFAVAIQADGKIIAAGSSSLDNEISYPMALVRYNADGSLDNTFGIGGKVITQSIQSASAIVIQTDGKIVAAGYVLGFEFPPGFITDFAIARYNANGSLDGSFDGDGIATTHFGNSDIARSIALQPDGKIIAAGSTYNTDPNRYDFALARYNPNGSPDTSFDTDGKVTTAINSSLGVYAVGVQRNGKIVAAGNSENNFALVRYNSNGSLDSSFGNEGKVTTDFFGSNDSAYALAIQRDGRIIAVGSAYSGARSDFAAARYIGDTVRVKFDYDGDGRADISVFRSAGNGTWYVMRSSNGYSYQSNLNVPWDKIAPADYDGDGRADIAQFNSATGTWYIFRSQAGYITVRFGASGDLPVPADYDGDGKDDVAVYRPSTGTWWIIRSGDGSFFVEKFGLAEDIPVAGDYDGDGRADLAVYRPSQGIWYLLQSTAGFGAARFGLAEDKPVVGDYDGDGKNDLAVYRPSTNVWYVLRSVNGNFFAVQFGLNGDSLAPADYDGDGKTDIAVFRNGVWYILQSSNGNVSYRQFGLSGDLPTQSAFIPQ